MHVLRNRVLKHGAWTCFYGYTHLGRLIPLRVRIVSSAVMANGRDVSNTYSCHYPALIEWSMSPEREGIKNFSK